MKLTHRRVNMAWTVHLVCFLLTVSLTPAGCTSLTKPTLKADSNTANILTTGKVTDTTSSAVTQGTASPAMTTLMTDTSMTGSHTNARGILTPAHTVTPGTASPAMTTLMTDTSMTGSHTNARGILTPAHTVTPVGVTLTVSPESVNVILHKEKLILCKVQGGQAEQFYWETPDGEDIEEMRDPRFTVISTEYASKLHIRNAQEKDEGVYVCRAELDSGEEKRAKVTITIIQPVSVSNVAPVREFEEGTDAVLSCNVTGIPQPTVTWLHDSRDVTHSVDGRIHKLPDDSLEIRNIMISDAGVYHCVGTVGERNEQKSLKTSVIVKYSPKMLLSNTEVYTWLGNPINISCSVLSVPMATISWNHQNRDLGGVFPMFLMADPPRFTSIIEVRVHTETDWGEYRCQAENSLGRISRSVWVREGDVPSVPEDVHVETNSTSVMVLLVNPASDGHLPLLGYKVEWRLETESEWTSMITSSEFVHIPGLRPHSLYYFRTAALNGRGQGEYSPTISVRTLSEPGSATSKWILIIIVCALIVLLLLLCFCMIKKS